MEKIQYCFVTQLSREEVARIISKQKSPWFSKGMHGKVIPGGTLFELSYHPPPIN